MKTFIERDCNLIPEAVRNDVINKVTESLESIITINNQFIVNDTIFFRQQPSKKITPCVMNKASYMSGRFQSTLEKLPNCQAETILNKQAIDGLITVDYQGYGYTIQDRNRILEVIHDFMEQEALPQSSIHTLFPMFYGMYVERGIYSIESLPEKHKDLFKKEVINKKFKIGVEFETGNIASSFRAINKLFVLFQNGDVDAGVFITSSDKGNCATRIWPVSNRNGSFQELKQRNYQEQISLPLIGIGFTPDGFSRETPFLGKNGKTYFPSRTGQKHTDGNYEIYLDEDGAEVLLPI